MDFRYMILEFRKEVVVDINLGVKLDSIQNHEIG